MFSNGEGRRLLDFGSDAGQFLELAQADVAADNGTIHVINTVLLPPAR